MAEKPKPKIGPQWNAMSITSNCWIAMKMIVDSYNIKNVVEFGSGISTQLFSEIGINVLSFETNMNQIEASTKLAPKAIVRPWDGRSIPKIDGDMAFIDGPYGGKNREPSYKAVAESNIPLVICHDSHRPEDRKWIDKYFGDWKILKEEKLLIVLEKQT